MVPVFFRVHSARAWYTPAKIGGGFSALQKGVYFSMCDQTKVLAVYREFKTEFFSGGSPDWFGGCWLEGDKLAVGVCGEGAPLDWLEQRLAEVRTVTRSESELKELMKQVTGRLKEPELALGVQGLGIDVRKNCLHVVLKEPLKEAVPWFQENISDSSAIRFKQDEFVSDADYHSGEIFGCVTAANGNHFGSIGYPAVDGAGQQGFVTAGHVVVGCPPDVYAHTVPGVNGSFTKIGVVSQCNNDTLDAAFVALDAGFGVRLTCPLFPAAPMSQMPNDTDLPPGAAVELYSRHHPRQIVMATVSFSSFDFSDIEDVYILDVGAGSPMMESGDSGSPAMIQGTHELVGIHKGHYTFARQVAVVKEKNIRTTLGVSLNAAAPT